MQAERDGNEIILNFDSRLDTETFVAACREHIGLVINTKRSEEFDPLAAATALAELVHEAHCLEPEAVEANINAATHEVDPPDSIRLNDERFELVVDAFEGFFSLSGVARALSGIKQIKPAYLSSDIEHRLQLAGHAATIYTETLQPLMEPAANA
jgi:hypothetical protein